MFDRGKNEDLFAILALLFIVFSIYGLIGFSVYLLCFKLLGIGATMSKVLGVAAVMLLMFVR